MPPPSCCARRRWGGANRRRRRPRLCWRFDRRLLAFGGNAMTAMAMGRFPARRGADRNAFLVFVGLVWIGVLSGFGTDSVSHVLAHGLDYPLIVHLHAVTFVSWLMLFTAQVALIRHGRADIHRKLGVAGAAL